MRLLCYSNETTTTIPATAVRRTSDEATSQAQEDTAIAARQCQGCEFAAGEALSNQTNTARRPAPTNSERPAKDVDVDTAILEKWLQRQCCDQYPAALRRHSASELLSSLLEQPRTCLLLTLRGQELDRTRQRLPTRRTRAETLEQ